MLVKQRELIPATELSGEFVLFNFLFKKESVHVNQSIELHGSIFIL